MSICTSANPEKQFKLQVVFCLEMLPKTILKGHLKIDLHCVRSSMQMNGTLFLLVLAGFGKWISSKLIVFLSAVLGFIPASHASV